MRRQNLSFELAMIEAKFSLNLGAISSTELNSPLAVSAPELMAGLADPKGLLVSRYGYRNSY